jgi:surfeit locus 1 family protein
MILLLLFSRKWVLTTLLVVIAVGVMIRLGYWQLDRLEKRRSFNERVQEQVDQPPLELAAQSLKTELEKALEGMEYRQVVVSGVYDHEAEVVLRNQAWNNQSGVNLITPLIIDGSGTAVLVNRGWIPFDDFSSGRLDQYAEEGKVEVRGVIRASQVRPEIGWRKDLIPRPGEPPLKAWNLVNVPGIASQIPFPLLPVYIQQAPDPSWTGMPVRSLPELELTEGPHLGYAIQWFIFAAILGIGYPIYVRREENNLDRPEKAREYLRPKSSSIR